MKKISIFVIIVIAIVLGIQSRDVHAGVSPLTGWAWSSNIGWISFNSTNMGACTLAPCSTYGVNIGTTTGSNVGNLGAVADLNDGYAWSPNVGWISFRSEHVSSCPVEGIDIPINGCRPSVDMSSGKVTGWARILSMINEDGGGWLHLSGTNHSSPDTSGYDSSSLRGVTLNPSKGIFSGFAYEPSAVGWVSFGAYSGVGGVCINNCNQDFENEITGTCRIGGATDPAVTRVGEAVRFTISALSGGSGSYTYRITPEEFDNYPLVTSYDHTYQVVGGYSPFIVVTDIENGRSSRIMCPRVTVVESQISSGLKLLISPAGVVIPSQYDTYDDRYQDALYKSTRVRQGDDVKLKWNIDPAVGYDVCISSGPSTMPFTVQTVSDFDILNTATTVPGSYIFSVTCSRAGGQGKTSFVRLNVADITIEEI